MSSRHPLHQLFRDFVELSALAISNAVDREHYAPREARYLQIVQQYTKEEVNEFPKMLAELVEALEYGFDDVLGRLYGTQLELTNKGSSQVFTPYTICVLLAKMTLHDVQDLLKEQKFITVAEPACGAGAMVIAVAQEMIDLGLNPQTQLHVTAIDLDLTCALMCYVQLSLLGIPAIVYHGDTLRLEMRSAWVTPFHILRGWTWKLRTTAQAPPTQIIDVPRPPAPDGSEGPHVQLSLFA